jgi:hypothetical protein
MEQSMEKDSDLKVFISNRQSVCDECGENLGSKAWITLVRDKGAMCLACADLDHLVFLPSGDGALTRRAKKYSTLTAVVLKWSSGRKRYERQGLLVEEGGLAKAEEECLSDSALRERRRERAAIRREELDQQYIDRFSGRVRELFPGCPPNREHEIAAHACLKYSGRVGRSATAKGLDEQAVILAVAAHIRHKETDYDRLLAAGVDRQEARSRVRSVVDDVLRRWR